jgi:putative ABC transport system permease protein
MLQDLRHALKLWAARPWQTALTIAVLAVAIGANTGAFSVVNALLLRSLPFRDPGRLAEIRGLIPPHDSARQFHAWCRQSSYLADAALFEDLDATLGGIAVPARIHVSQASGNFFTVLGTQPVLGRGFSSADEVDAPGWGSAGPNAVTVISFGLWQQIFNADPKALGATIRVDGNPLTVIGVAPPGFDFPHQTVLWKPAAFSPGNNGWATVARLTPGISWAWARAAFAVETKRLSQDKQGANLFPPELASLRDAIAGPAKNASLVFMSAVMFVLLIACTNVANILSARTADRSPELSIRSALGASHGRLLRQLVTESLLLSLVASGAGLIVAEWTVALAAKVSPPTLGAQGYSILDARVVAFTVSLATGTALLFSILPAICLARISSGPWRTSGHRRSRQIREALVGGQIILMVTLLAGSVSLGRAFSSLMKIDRGYEQQHLITINISLDGTSHQSDQSRLAYFEQVLDRLRRLPGVRAASATEFLPLYASAFVGGPFGIDGREAGRSSTMIPVLSQYFATMGTKLLGGREFSDAEIRAGERVAVVNQQFASSFGNMRDIIGHQLTIGNDHWKIVGIVQGMEYETDPTIAKGNEVFVPATNPGSFFSTFVVRVNGNAEARLAEIRDLVRSVDQEVPVFAAKTMEQRINEVFARPNFYRTASLFFASFALLLSAVGIYGSVSYAVVQRTREMGIRLALGTTPVRLRRMLLHQGLRMVAFTAIWGMAGAQLSSRFIELLIDGASPIGLGTSAGLMVLLLVITSTSVWHASRGIDRFDVTALLRAE